jgi:hypothetical protein
MDDLDRIDGDALSSPPAIERRSASKGDVKRR